MLDTRVPTDPAACRDTGRWLGDAADDLHGAGTVLRDSRASSEEVWGGDAGEAFREHVRAGQDDADELSYSLTRTGSALTTFADDIDTVVATMTRARDVAAAAGLTVTPDGIEPPGPAPVVPTPSTPTSADLELLDPLLAAGEHERRVAAYTEAETTVAQARGDETAAHEALGRAVRDEQTLWDSIKGNSAFIRAEVLLGTPTALAHASTTWLDEAARLRSTLGRRGRSSTSPAPPPPSAPTRSPATCATKAGRGRRTTDGRRRIDCWVRSRSPTVSPGRSPALGNPIAKVPVIGWGLTALQIAHEVDGGKPADRAVASGAAGAVAGAAAGSALSSALLTAGAAGGPAILGGVLLGMGTTAVVGWAVHRYWEDIEDSAVGQAVADSPVGRALGAIF